jgi:hypothetical protein
MRDIKQGGQISEGFSWMCLFIRTNILRTLGFKYDKCHKKDKNIFLSVMGVF